MNSLALFIILPAAYLLGGLSPGHWLVRRRTGTDVRAQGSGVTGATNAGRVLGRGGFILVLLLDAGKGAAAVALARGLDSTASGQFAAGLAVVAGHIWPAQLGFRGGRGVAPLLGAWLVLAPLAVAGAAALALLARATSVRFIFAGLIGVAALPVFTWPAMHDPGAVAVAFAACTLVLFAHRPHLRPARPASPP